MMARNPFQYLRPVPPERFVGRQALVESMAQELTWDEGDSQAVIAGRRCGKSSLLLTLAHRLRQPEVWAAGDCRILPLYFDFKAKSFASAEEFFAHTLGEVRRRVDVSVRRRPNDGWADPVALDADWFTALADRDELTFDPDFEDALGYVLDQLDAPLAPVRLVLLLDEVDEALGHAWTQPLFNQLRALIYASDLSARVRLVLTGSRRFLDEVSSRGSPLWNVLKLHYLTVFVRTDIDELVRSAGSIPHPVAEAVWRQSGGHPFLAQYLLHHLWEQTAGTDLDAVEAGLIQDLARRFCSERLTDLEGWVHGVEQVGLQAYAALAANEDWVEEEQIVAAVHDPRLNVKRGLMALCYHGVAIHDESWSRYRMAGDLFKNWFVANRPRLLTPTPSTVPPDDKQAALRDLRHALAILYEDEVAIRRVATDAGMDIGRITFGNSATNMWHAVLTEAEKTNKVSAIIAVAQHDYGENEPLQAAAEAYR